MTRRELLLSAALAPAASLEMVMTVRGPVRPAELGLCLPHEHLFSIFGEEPAERAEYDVPKLMGEVSRYVNSLRFLGCRAIADGTTAWFGRDASLLRRVSTATGVHVLTNTGYYGAANDRYVPRSAREESASQIAARWVSEYTGGIDGTGVKPGFMKLGVDAGPLSAIDEKLFEAACLAHHETGLLITVHTADAVEATGRQLELLKKHGIRADAWVWIHANNCKDEGALKSAAEAGAWLSFDGVAPENVERHLALVGMMKSMGRLKQVLLSHDGNSFRAGGRPMKPYSGLFTHFIPALREAKYSETEIRLMTVDNPARALTIGKRLL
ncbi:MAG: phosphotriesterase [Bryobacteraceae bacterium]|nr:phosphotriesterase [Bryobacteraceae bacterium]